MATSGKPPGEVDKLFHLGEFLRSRAESLCRQLELAGKPETLNKAWPLKRAGIISGYVSGGHFGYTLGTKLAQMPTSIGIDHAELPCEKEEIPGEPASKA